MLSIIGSILLILLLAFFILPLFIKKTYTVGAEILINRPNTAVFDYVRFLENQVHYNKWVMADPNVKRTGTGEDGKQGYILAWDSLMKNVGKGEQEITGITTGSKIITRVRFEKPFKNVADAEMSTIASTADQTKLVWVMQGQNAYPMNIMNLFIPGMLSKDMAQSLGNLKAVLEK